MRIFQAVVVMCILSSCGGAHGSDITFAGKIDERDYRAHYQSIPHDELKERCESLTLSYAELIDMIESYQKVDSASAYMILEVTPCVFEGDFDFDGRAARFRWYPSGYLMISYPEDEGAERDYYICLGSLDEEGAFSCDDEHKW